MTAIRRPDPIFVATLLTIPAAFLAFETLHLDAVGLYYDELHQAAGSFAYLGKRVPFFALLPLDGLPLYNMPYSGALKTAVYGLYLKFVDPEFSVTSWRLVGIGFVSIGLFGFIALARRGFRPLPLIVVAVLTASDGTILLCSRYDWGPVALALCLRLLLIGVYLRREGTASESRAYPFVMGLLVGIAIFEKLSSVVLVLPLLVMLASSRHRSGRHLLATSAGLGLGASVLVATNLVSLFADQTIFSLSRAGDPPLRSWSMFAAYLGSILELGAGSEARYFILGNGPPAGLLTLERWLMPTLLAATLYLSLACRTAASARLATVSLASYVLLAIALYFLPRKIWIHHWILAAPFQYVAIGLGLNAVLETRFRRVHDRILRAGFLVLIAILLMARLLNAMSLGTAYWKGDASRGWDRSKTALGQLAASDASEAIFVAADWGVATQIYCLSNGNADLVHELFWHYRDVSELVALQNSHRGKTIYAVALSPSSSVNPAATEGIFRDLAGSGYWREAALEPEFAALKSVTVRKFGWLGSGGEP